MAGVSRECDHATLRKIVIVENSFDCKNLCPKSLPLTTIIAIQTALCRFSHSWWYMQTKSTSHENFIGVYGSQAGSLSANSHGRFFAGDVVFLHLYQNLNIQVAKIADVLG